MQSSCARCLIRNPIDLIVLRESSAGFPSGSVSYPNYLDWRTSQHTFADLALARRDSYNFAIPGGQNGAGAQSTADESASNFLEVLAMKPLIGRDFVGSRRCPGSAPVVMINETFWRTRFGGFANGVSGSKSSSTVSRARSSAFCPRR